MAEERIYPRVKSEWKLLLTTDGENKQIGYVLNISLTGVLLFLYEDYKIELGKHRFTLKLENKQLSPSELTISGLKEWNKKGKNAFFLAIKLDKLDKVKRTAFIHFLSRSDKLHVQVFLLENA